MTSLGRPRRKWEVILKLFLNKSDVKVWTQFCCLRVKSDGRHFWTGDEPLGLIKDGEFADRLSHYQLLTKNSSPWSWFSEKFRLALRPGFYFGTTQFESRPGHRILRLRSFLSYPSSCDCQAVPRNTTRLSRFKLSLILHPQLPSGFIRCYT
jgi:hypothetical protein